MEVNTQRRKAGLDEKVPDLQRSLDTVRFLKTRKVGHLHYINIAVLSLDHSRNQTL